MEYPTQNDLLAVMRGANGLASTDTRLKYAARHFGLFEEEASQIRLFGRVFPKTANFWQMVRDA